ncbi:hypothetical protein M0534_00795 [Methylonatrum kenyense]|uniref:hypothetical protein n=1 Tax=Methylonatrum kenyense TaxID=455253 RepID=UPI0020BD7A0B|nr:hypothetical protein [Methylonatrum kenyense]MCK8514870.1 hypothetical protein [Methylonatrum kenyense]
MTVAERERGRAPGGTRDTEAFPARLLQATIDSLEAGERRVILDLGGAQPGSLDLLSGFRCRYCIGDVLDDLMRLDARQEPVSLDAVIDELLPASVFGNADLVLCWQLLDYLETPVLEALGRRLRHLLASGGLIHAITEYSASDMPDPMHPLFLDRDGAVRYASVRSGSRRPAPRHAPAELQKRLGGLQMERAVLLGNGMQEYLFRL